MQILCTDDRGLLKIIINAFHVQCLPPWPQSRMFACPGAKQVVPNTNTTTLFHLGDPEAVILVTQL
jgi:hypothetical protein